MGNGAAGVLGQTVLNGVEKAIKRDLECVTTQALSLVAGSAWAQGSLIGHVFRDHAQ